MQQLSSLTRYVIMVIILSHFTSSSPAQQNKFTGFYINLQGDTVKGIFSRYRQWNYNPDSVRFLSFQSGKQVMLTPSVCQEFHIDGYETYIAFNGKRMTNPMAFYQSAPEDNSDRYDMITTFLREFAISDAGNFYIFKDKSRFNLYYSSANGVITELLQKVYVTGNHLIQSATYKKQLQSLFPERTEEINHLLFSEEDLNIFLSKQKKDIITFKKVQTSYGGFYLSGGVSLNSLKFTPDASMDFSGKNYESRSAPLVSIGYVVPFSRNFSRGFFLSQIKISSFKHTVEQLSDDAHTVHSTTFQSSPMISLGFNFGYNIVNYPDLKISVAPGAGVNFLTKFEQIDRYKFSSTNSSTAVTKMDHLNPVIDLQTTVIIKNRYIIWSAYNLAKQVTIYPSVKDKFTSRQLGVGYRFN